MSSVLKKVKKAVKSVAKGVERIGKDVVDVHKDALAPITTDLARDIGDIFQPPLPKIPGPSAGSATPTTGAGPNVDLAATESRRRTSGAAKGTRKLKVPLGGLR